MPRGRSLDTLPRAIIQAKVTIHVRGQTVLNTARFVKENYGVDAHERVLAALPDHGATFLGPLRDASWKPIDDVIAYMETARRLLAPDDASFHRRIGRLSGQITGRGGFGLFIGRDPATAVGRATFMWRFLYDVGRIERVRSEPRAITIRIHDFRTSSPVWCERMAGFLEAIMELAHAQAPVVSETACVHFGQEYCEMQGSWQ